MLRAGRGGPRERVVCPILQYRKIGHSPSERRRTRRELPQSACRNRCVHGPELPQPARLYITITIIFQLFAALAGAQTIEYTLTPATNTRTDQQKEYHPMSDYLVYVGSYAQGDEEGIHVYSFDTGTSTLTPQSSVGGVENPSFLDISPDRRYLYAIGESSEVNGVPGGAVAAFAIDQQSGALTHINTQSAVGTGPCHISVDPTGCHVFVANYGGGSVAILPINEDGSLGEASDFVQHQGSSVDASRQQEPHAHSIWVTPNNKHAFAPDLGLDKIKIYAIDHQSGKLSEQTSGEVDPGQGPRHLDFHPDGRRAYVINEMGNTVTVFDYDAEAGTLAAVQTISTLPEGYSEVSHTADIHVHPNGKFLYGSNRGHDSIAIYAIDPDNGQLATIEIVATGGNGPRNFGIDPTGNYLIAGNHGSNDIFTFKIDQATGRLTAVGERVEVPSPVCHKFIPGF